LTFVYDKLKESVNDKIRSTKMLGL